MRAPSGPISLSALTAKIGQVIGRSEWHEIDQSRIDRFADLTDDRQFIHVDPARAAAETPFGGAIAHGFLVLSLLSAMAARVLPTLEGAVAGINYGFDRVRFLAPVLAGSRVRGIFTIGDVVRRNPGEVLIRLAVTVEIENQAKPALMADWLALSLLDRAGKA